MRTLGAAFFFRLLNGIIGFRIKANRADPQRQFYAIISFCKSATELAIKSSLCGNAT
jgi:hypothetical protein